MAERLFHIWRRTAVRQTQSDAQRTAAGERPAADNRRKSKQQRSGLATKKQRTLSDRRKAAGTGTPQAKSER